MKKHKDHKKTGPQTPPALAPSGPVLTNTQWRGILAGISLAGIGFTILSLADPAGRNWASYLCPFLILGGYAVIGAALWKKYPSN